MIKRLTLQDFDNIFPRMSEGFPQEELKSYEQFKYLLSTDNYVIYGYFDSDVLVGYAVLCLYEDCFWLDYLHIYAENQNKQYGHKLIKELLETNPDKKGIFLEVEPLDSDDYNDNKVKRMRFYDRLNATRINIDYLFPTSYGSLPLNLYFIPNEKITLLEKETIQNMLTFVMKFVHKDIPHALKLLRTYYDQIESVEIFHFTFEDIDMNKEEEVTAVGRLIYYTDPFIYPALLDSVDNSVKAAKSLLISDSIFNQKNIKVGKINGEVAGFMLTVNKFPRNNHLEMENAIRESLGYLPRDFNQVMEGYFDLLDIERDYIEIVSLAVLPEYRRMKVASKMLYTLSSKETYRLACIRDNTKARDLYKKCGFEFLEEYSGYIDVPCVELIKRRSK